MVVERPGGQKLAVVMVGLPARGKTFVARKLLGYLSWLGYRTLSVNIGDYRRARAAAKQVISNRIEGYLSSRLAFFLMQIRPTERYIWLSRHGESESNLTDRIGGDAPLTERGTEYAHALAAFVRTRTVRPVVWTSTL